MAIRFNADEIFEMAEQIERNGAKFYRRAAQFAASVDSRQQLESLAQMEDSHLETFASMRAELSGRERQATTYDPYDEGALYLKAVADGYVFDVSVDPSERLTGKQSMEDIYLIAIGLEKDSIVFYLGLRDAVPQELGRDKVEKIIKEEMGHVTLLSSQLAAAKQQG